MGFRAFQKSLWQASVEMSKHKERLLQIWADKPNHLFVPLPKF